MDKNTLNYYKIIGKVQSAVSQSETLDGALKEGLRIILSNSAADYGVLWYMNRREGRLRPYYWICPIDLTTASFAPGEGIPGQCWESGSAVSLPDYAGEKGSCDLYEKLGVSSLCCIPFGGEDEPFGCIELMKSSAAGPFTEEEADICQVLVLMADIAFREKNGFRDELYPQKVILSAKDICKEFKNGDTVTKVLKGANLEVVEGELIIILGASGCGKSTLLNIIAGLDKATSGHFYFDGRDMTDSSEQELTAYRRENIGFIFQSYNLMPNLTAKENLDLVAELVEDPLDSVEVLNMVGLEGRSHQYPSQLSGGQQQRVSIARALVKKPRIIFADEPTAALDYKTSIEVLAVMEDIVRRGTTLLMVTHNEEIARMANRVIRMRDGKSYEVTVNHFPAKAAELMW